MTATLMILTLLILGVFEIGALVTLRRPANPLRLEEVNTSGWIWLVAIWFARTLILIFLGPLPVVYHGVANMVIAVGFTGAIDALLGIRLFSWLRFMHRNK